MPRFARGSSSCKAKAKDPQLVRSLGLRIFFSYFRGMKLDPDSLILAFDMEGLSDHHLDGYVMENLEHIEAFLKKYL